MSLLNATLTADLLLEDLFLEEFGKNVNEDHLDMIVAFCEQAEEEDVFLSLIMPSRKRKSSESDPFETKEAQSSSCVVFISMLSGGMYRLFTKLLFRCILGGYD